MKNNKKVNQCTLFNRTNLIKIYKSVMKKMIKILFNHANK